MKSIPLTLVEALVLLKLMELENEISIAFGGEPTSATTVILTDANPVGHVDSDEIDCLLGQLDDFSSGNHDINAASKTLRSKLESLKK